MIEAVVAAQGAKQAATDEPQGRLRAPARQRNEALRVAAEDSQSLESRSDYSSQIGKTKFTSIDGVKVVQYTDSSGAVVMQIPPEMYVRLAQTIGRDAAERMYGKPLVITQSDLAVPGAGERGSATMVQGVGGSQTAQQSYQVQKRPQAEEVSQAQQKLQEAARQEPPANTNKSEEAREGTRSNPAEEAKDAQIAAARKGDQKGSLVDILA